MLQHPRVPASQVLDRVLVLEMVRVTEAAAVAASKWIGRGDNDSADAAAVEAWLTWVLNSGPLWTGLVALVITVTVVGLAFAPRSRSRDHRADGADPHR